MTFAQLKLLALGQLGEDAQDLPEYEQALGTYINEGYAALCQSAYHPLRSMEVALTGSEFSLALLAPVPMRILHIHGAFPLRFIQTGDTVRVFTGGLQTDRVRVTYEYLPPPMAQPDDVPVLPEAAHTALADWATARVLGTGSRSRQAKAEFFLMRFYEAKGRLTPQGAADRLYNQFN